jgi:hypothetical protein
MTWNELLEEFEQVLRELQATMPEEDWVLFLDSVYKVLYNGD